MRALAIALLGGLAGCAVLPIAGRVPDGAAVIYIIDQGWHTDIGIPIEELKGPVARLVRRFPGVRVVVFGFGQREYYMAAHPDSGDMLAALLPGTSVLLLTALRLPPAEVFPGRPIVILHLPDAGLDRIVNRLWEEMEKAPDGSAISLAQGPTTDSVFYASNETYDAFHTCNTWAAILLRDGGLPINPHVVFSEQVMRQAAWLASQQQ